MPAVHSKSNSDETSLVGKRAFLVLRLAICYVDMTTDTLNACTLWHEGHKVWGSLMLSFIVLPPIVTWFFLWENHMAKIQDLVLIVCQVNPIKELLDSWEDGNESRGFIWYTAAEGLGESPLTGILTAYILAFGYNNSYSFYFGVVWAFVTISKTATAINYYARKPEPSKAKYILEFAQRVPRVGMRICFLACFAYLMKPLTIDTFATSEGLAEEDAHDTQIAIFAAVMFSVACNTSLLKVQKPECPLAIQIFFGTIMVFTEPLRFLYVFDQMTPAYWQIRCAEFAFLFAIAVNPLAPSPRIHELYDNSPFLVHCLLGTVLGVICMLVVGCLIQRGQVDATSRVDDDTVHGYYYSAFTPEIADASSSLARRARNIQNRFVEVVADQDLIMINLFIKLEGADPNDPCVLFAAMTARYGTGKWPTLTDTSSGASMESFNMDIWKRLVKERMPIEIDELMTFGSGRLQQGGFTIDKLREIGFTTNQLMDVGFRGNLIDIAASGDVERLILVARDKNVDVNLGDYDNRTALHLAVSEGKVEIVKCLLEDLKAEKNPEDRWGNTPLDDAERTNRKDIVEYLQQQGCIHGQNAAPFTAREHEEYANLCRAAASGNLERLRELAGKQKKNGMDLNHGDYDRRTAIHLAASEGKLEVVKCLVEEFKVRVDVRDRWGGTPLDDAKRGNHVSIMRYLEDDGFGPRISR